MTPVDRGGSTIRLVTAFCSGALLLGHAVPAAAQRPRTFTHADSLRGSTTAPARTWWDVTFYDLHVAVHPADSTIAGWNTITYRVVRPAGEMQIDLMAPLVLDSVTQGGQSPAIRNDGDAHFVTLIAPQRIGEQGKVTAWYHGRP
ncbi:MAG: hypothetical protein ACREL5_07645, partial [Gemmatimonadales bacterium]